MERELPDEMLSWNSQQTRQSKIVEQLSAIQQSNLQKLLDELQMFYSLYKAEQQLWKTQLTLEQHVQFA